MSRTLVTGGCGYFGSLLTRHLLEHGHDVRVFDITGDTNLDVEMVVGDIRDKDAVEAAVRDVDVVFHNVAQVPLVRDLMLLETVNVNGTRILLDAASSSGVSRVVHTSSSAVFGIPRTNPVLATTPMSPVEPYGAAKVQAEQICAEYTERLDVSIIRPRTILGHGRLGIFGVLFDWVRDGADPFVFGRGENRYQFVHADDLAELCRVVANLPGSHVFNAGTDRFGTMYEALDALCQHAGTGSQVRRIPAVPASTIMRAASALRLAPFAPYHWLMYGRSVWFDIGDTTEATGWHPRWSNDEMFQQSYDWFVENRARLAGASQHSRPARQGALSVLKYGTQLLPRRS